MSTKVLTIPYAEFQLRVSMAAPDCIQQKMPTAAYVHVFNRAWFREQFWPYWDNVKKALNAQLLNKPETNNAKRGTCDEITKMFVAHLILATRQLHGDEDVGVAALESSILIPDGFSLNMVHGFGGHRTIVVGLTDDGENYEVEFAEPQLTYAQYKTTPVENAVAAGVVYAERWV